MKMFFSYFLYSRIRQQVKFGAYKLGSQFMSADAIASWIRVKAYGLLGLLMTFWFLIFINTFTMLTNNSVLVKQPNVYFFYACFAAIGANFTKRKALNYEYYEKIFSTWPDSKKRRLDILMTTCELGSFALCIYLNVIRAKFEK